MRGVTERTLSSMLMEMRKLDRDRDRVLHPSTVEQMVEKYRLPIGPCLPHLQIKFQDGNFVGITNYEYLVKFLGERREETMKKQEAKVINFLIDCSLTINDIIGVKLLID